MELPIDAWPCEKKVAAYLKEVGVRWEYEKPLFLIDQFNKPRIYVPDFFLPELNTYLEVIGSKVNFDKKHRYQKQAYEKNDIQIIYVKTYESGWDAKLSDDIYEYLHKMTKNLLEALRNMGQKYSREHPELRDVLGEILIRLYDIEGIPDEELDDDDKEFLESLESNDVWQKYLKSLKKD